MAYDAAIGTVILFGGNDIDSGGDLNDTWTWDGVTWTQQFPRISPPPRDSAGFTYNDAAQTVVLFGGSGNTSGDGVVMNDTWIWDGKAKEWAQRFPDSSPSPRRTRMTYDKATQTIVLFGGDIEQYGCCDVFYADTWIWDGLTWTQQFPASSPTARTLNSLTYDAEVDRAILFGGYSEPGVGLNDTWTWDGTAWTQIQTTFAPSPRWAQAVTFDPKSRGLILSGGVVTGFTAVADTWFLLSSRR